jgi:hypothetical protein
MRKPAQTLERKVSSSGRLGGYNESEYNTSENISENNIPTKDKNMIINKASIIFC